METLWYGAALTAAAVTSTAVTFGAVRWMLKEPREPER